MTATAEAALSGWQELSTEDGLRVVGCPGSGWFVLGRLNSVVARYPGELAICVALAMYREEGDGLTYAQIVESATGKRLEAKDQGAQ